MSELSEYSTFDPKDSWTVRLQRAQKLLMDSDTPLPVRDAVNTLIQHAQHLESRVDKLDHAKNFQAAVRGGLSGC